MGSTKKKNSLNSARLFHQFTSIWRFNFDVIQSNMTKRTTIQDLAQATGLSTATVDRALNGRPNVSARAVARVAEAAEQLGYHASGLARFRAEAATRPSMRLGFVLQKPKQAFYQSFAAQLQTAAHARSDIRITCDIRFPQSQGIDAYASVIETTAATSDAIAIVAPNHPRLAQLVETIARSGTPVFTLLNDLAVQHRTAYFGTDNMKVGRLAAWMLTTLIKQPGELAIFVGSGRWYGHMMRETGFQGYLRQHAPDFSLLDSIVNLDTRQVTYEATRDLLNRRPHVKGVYVAGGGMEGAISALRELRPPGRVGLVVNELTHESQTALVDRYVAMVLATPLEALCRRCINAMTKTQHDRKDVGQIFLDPSIYLPESF